MSVNVTVVVNENPVSVTASPVNAIVNVSTDTFASARAVQAAAEAEASALLAEGYAIQTAQDVIATNTDAIATAADRLATETARDEIVDKVIFTPANDEDVLTFVASSNKFEPRPSSGGGGGLPVGNENDLLQANNLGVFVPNTLDNVLEPRIEFVFFGDAVSPLPLVNGGYINAIIGNTITISEPVFLRRLSVYSNDVANISIQIRTGHVSGLGTLVFSKIVPVIIGKNDIDIGFGFSVGNFNIIKATTAGTLWRNNSGVSYPYTTGGFSIVGSFGGATAYYYFYDIVLGNEKALDFNNVSDGAVLQADNTGVFKPFNQALQGRQAFINASPLFMYQTIDTFQRANSALLGDADRGGAWDQTGNHVILNGYLNGTVNVDTGIPCIITTVGTSTARGKTCEFDYNSKGGANSFVSVIIAYNDDDNYLVVNFHSTILRIRVKSAGVFTDLLSTTVNPVIEWAGKVNVSSSINGITVGWSTKYEIINYTIANPSTARDLIVSGFDKNGFLLRGNTFIKNFRISQR